jgi:hypothetical protein
LIISEIISVISPRSLGSSSIIVLYFVLIPSLSLSQWGLVYCSPREDARAQ